MSNQSVFKILSIDFDFFQDVPIGIMMNHYPDGIDLPETMSDLVWAVKYKHHKDEVRKAKINKPLLNKAIEILKNQRVDIPVMIANSHVRIYDFVKEISGDKKLDLINVDYHHDMFNENDVMDCGNWITFLKRENKIERLTWITRRKALTMYGLKAKETQKCRLKFDFSEIENKQFDAVFICRSDPWFPPHLDKYFLTLTKEGCCWFINAVQEDRVSKPRTLPKL